MCTAGEFRSNSDHVRVVFQPVDDMWRSGFVMEFVWLAAPAAAVWLCERRAAPDDWKPSGSVEAMKIVK